jgi:hypothetical protein
MGKKKTKPLIEVMGLAVKVTESIDALRHCIEHEDITHDSADTQVVLLTEAQHDLFVASRDLLETCVRLYNRIQTAASHARMEEVKRQLKGG